MRAVLKKWIFFFCTVLLLLSCTKTYTKEELNELFEPITSKYGIKIVYQIDEDFAPILIGGDRAQFSKIEPVDKRVLACYGAILAKALEKYPVHVIKAYLNKVYFAKTITVEGFGYGGTYDQFRRIIYLVNDGQLNDDQAIANFHHEFSSLLLNRHSFFLNPWNDQNPQSFKYLQETSKDWTSIWKNVRFSGEGTEADYEKGFMNNYGETTFENDFNEYAAMVFTHPQKFKQIMNQYPRVRGKFLILLEFYHKIDPIFTEEYLLGKK